MLMPGQANRAVTEDNPNKNDTPKKNQRQSPFFPAISDDDLRPARASGGAVNLKALARIAKKTISQSSESLLQKTDEHVARALAIAGRDI
jgi:hypothetical protein